MQLALRLFAWGVGLFPLKHRSKEPACRSWDDYVCTQDQAARFTNYGIRLGLVNDEVGSLGVIDTDSPETEAWVAAHVPTTPFVVTTGKGRHRYFRLRGPVDKFLHRDGLTIEFRNQGQYVVGPGSVHPSGAVYTPADWSWRFEDIPFFPSATYQFHDGSNVGPSGRAASAEFEIPDRVLAGERHHQLFRQLRSMKALQVEKRVAREMISLANRNLCEPPLREDHTFEAWFERAWSNPDRPMDCTRSFVGIPDLPLESGPDVDLDNVDMEGF